MIKRRYYRFEHGDRDAPSESSSSSDSEVEAEATDDTEVEEDDDEEEGNVVTDVREKGEDCSSSGYESEHSSANEVNLDSSGLHTSDEEVAAQNGGPIIGSFPSAEGNAALVSPQHSPVKDEIQLDATNCVIKCKSVFKCRLCPRIVCLSEETLKAHLNSKRHARSEKLLREGRLKLMLNEAGKIEGEASPEDHATPTVSGQKSAKPKKKGKGRWKQKKRSKLEAQPRKAGRSTENREKRRKRDS